MKLGQNIQAPTQRAATAGQAAFGKTSPNAGQRSFQELLGEQKGAAAAQPTNSPRGEPVAVAPAAKAEAAGMPSTLQLAGQGAARERTGA